jgi:YD repeat-containing protein
MTDPVNRTGTFAYDLAGRLTSQTDRDGNVVNSQYDGDNRLTQQVWLSGGVAVNTLVYSYDNNANLLTAQDSHGAYTMAYDALDRLTAQQEPFGLALTMAFDAAGNRSQVQDSFGGTTTSLYDAAHRLTTREFSTGGATPLRIDLGYTARDQLTTMTRYSERGQDNRRESRLP